MDLEKTNAKFTQILNSGRSWAYQAQVWEGLGILLRAFGRLLVVFGRSSSNFFLVLAQDGLQKAFWIDFGSILGGIGGDLEGFGRIWGRFPSIFNCILEGLGKTSLEFLGRL